MKVLIQQARHGAYWSCNLGWVERRDCATVYKGVVEAVDCCIENITGGADIILEFGGRQPDFHLRHPGRASR